MPDFINTVVTTFNQYAKDYPLPASAIGIWLLTTVTYFCKEIPRRATDLFLRTFTTKLVLISTSDTYHQFLKWYNSEGFSSNSRSIKISNGQWGYDAMVKAMGYGNHYFIFNRTPIKLNLQKLETQGSSREQDEVTMTILGRSHKTYDKIFKLIKDKDLDSDKVIVHSFDDDWRRESEQRRRPLDTVCLNKGVKEKIIKVIDDFKKREDFNIRHGINHQTAIILYGPGGTGKSSIIKAIASHYEINVHRLSSSALSNIEKAFSRLPENALVSIEDIDSNSGLHEREREKTKSEETQETPISEMFTLTSMSDVLNAIDGIHCSHGRILIATTNHLDKLDKALLRSGRFDLKIEIGYADNYAVEQFIDRFYKGHSLPEGFDIKPETVCSDIQLHALNNLENFENFISLIAK